MVSVPSSGVRSKGLLIWIPIVSRNISDKAKESPLWLQMDCGRGQQCASGACDTFGTRRHSELLEINQSASKSKKTPHHHSLSFKPFNIQRLVGFPPPSETCGDQRVIVNDRAPARHADAAMNREQRTFQVGMAQQMVFEKRLRLQEKEEKESKNGRGFSLCRKHQVTLQEYLDYMENRACCCLKKGSSSEMGAWERACEVECHLIADLTILYRNQKQGERDKRLLIIFMLYPHCPG